MEATIRDVLNWILDIHVYKVLVILVIMVLYAAWVVGKD